MPQRSQSKQNTRQDDHNHIEKLAIDREVWWHGAIHSGTVCDGHIRVKYIHSNAPLIDMEKQATL